MRAWRRRLLSALIAGAVVAVVAAVVVYVGAQVTYNRYNAIVSHDSSSVDAAMDARADLLDSAAANAAALVAQTQQGRAQALSSASASWSKFKNDFRRSWQNLSDRTNGELAAFQAADAAETDYDQAIGAMNAALAANPPNTDAARTAFLQANTVLEQRLLPALSSGLEGVKVADMGSDYASTSSTIEGWLYGVLAVSVILLAVLGAGYFLTLRMHHLLTLELIIALVLVIAVGAWVGLQLRRADTQSKVMVSEAYNSVAGVRDEIALVSQQHERESIALFDSANAATHFAAFDDFTLEVEQGLCGYAGCTAQPFTSLGAQDTIAAPVVAAGLNGETEFGLARPPLVSNATFSGEAVALETARQQYRGFLNADQAVRQQVQAGNLPAAATQSAGAVAGSYQATVAALARAGDAARSVYDSSWRSVESAMTIARVLAVGEVVAGLLLARGLWRRRAELFPVRGE
ncbi:MAG TPA: hypothetical protein VFA70_00095 [Dehalococcoidia bacterium]|nr:hypothetical protein [Dehalococcoidia bacterium]